MGRRIAVEVDERGHRLHSRRRRGGDVIDDEFANLKARERGLTDYLEQLTYENKRLNQELALAEQRLGHHCDCSTRRARGDEWDIREHRHREVRLANENMTLRARVQDLTRSLKDALWRITDWQRRYSDLERRTVKLRHNLDRYISANDELHRVVEELERRSHRKRR